MTTKSLYWKITAKQNNNEQIVKHYPENNYQKLHQYGNGPFYFLGKPPHTLDGKSGVYLIKVDGQVKYVGCTLDGRRRFSEYATIYDAKCHENGQQTSCRINTNIGSELEKGHRVEVFFYITEEYRELESFLILVFSPEWNLAKNIFFN